MSRIKIKGLGIALFAALMVMALPAAASAQNATSCPDNQEPVNGYCEPVPNDPDGDGLSNETEQDLGTNPNDADTDDDGFRDRQDRCPTLAGPNGGCPTFTAGSTPSQTPPRGRERPARVDLTVNRKRTKRGLILKSRGTVVPPDGLAVERACTDTTTVRVTVKSGKRTVSSRRARLRDDCSFRSRVKFTVGRRLRGRSMKVRAAFIGNDEMEPRRSKFVSVGRP